MSQEPEQEPTEIRMVSMTQEHLHAALRDLEQLARAGGLSDDDIAEVYSDSIELLEDN